MTLKWIQEILSGHRISSSVAALNVGISLQTFTNPKSLHTQEMTINNVLYLFTQQSWNIAWTGLIFSLMPTSLQPLMFSVLDLFKYIYCQTILQTLGFTQKQTLTIYFETTHYFTLFSLGPCYFTVNDYTTGQLCCSLFGVQTFYWHLFRQNSISFGNLSWSYSAHLSDRGSDIFFIAISSLKINGKNTFRYSKMKRALVPKQFFTNIAKIHQHFVHIAYKML